MCALACGGKLFDFECAAWQGQLSIIKPEEKQELARLKATLSDRLAPTRDNNGFRKLLVVLSRAGKLALTYDNLAVCSRNSLVPT